MSQLYLQQRSPQESQQESPQPQSQQVQQPKEEVWDDGVATFIKSLLHMLQDPDNNEVIFW